MAQVQRISAGGIVRGLAPLLLAGLCAVHGLRSAAQSEPDFPDASRHALNGALFLDLFRDKAIGDPVRYAREYYARLPATSIPYHPPLFPVFEALLYSIFGVSNFTARLSVAITVGLACLLLYRLVCLTHGSRVFAASVVLVFYAMPSSQWLSSEVMLEFPSLVLVLAALLCLRQTDSEGWRLGPWLRFAAFGIAAVWTKQQAVFLAGVPFVYVGLQRRARELARRGIWISAAVMILGSAGFYTISRAANSESSVEWHEKKLRTMGAFGHYIWERVVIYSRAAYIETGRLDAALFVLSVVFYIWLRKRDGPFGKCDLYAATIVSLMGLLAVMPFVGSRYLFYMLPAISVFVCTLLYQAGLILFRTQYAWMAPATLAALNLALYLHEPLTMRGPAEAAQFVLRKKARRVLYCGTENGSFIFAVRASEPHSRLAVIRGDKVAGMIQAPGDLMRFLQKYGVEQVVLESHPSASGLDACDALARTPPAQLAMEREVRIDSGEAYLRGAIRIYRVPEAGANPDNFLVLPSGIVKGGIAIDLSDARTQ